jgi:hypothetical protein
MKTTGWQQHSVRGFLAGVVRKRLKLKLSSKKVDGNRVYRIAGASSGKTEARPQRLPRGECCPCSLSDYADAVRKPDDRGDPWHCLRLGVVYLIWDRSFDGGSQSCAIGEYRCDYAYHAQMEPLNAVASVAAGGDAVEIWAGTQSQTTATEAPAKFLGISRDKVKLHDLLMGGGFGRRGNRDVDFIMDAVMLSKEIGSPVKVMWTREDDVHNGRFRPLSAHYLRAAFDASGKLTAWHHRLAADRITPFMDRIRFQEGGGKDGMVMAGCRPRVRGRNLGLERLKSSRFKSVLSPGGLMRSPRRTRKKFTLCLPKPSRPEKT